MRIELAWGRSRRWFLRRFAKPYIARQLATRRGECGACPHDIIDSRDLKYYRNVCGYYWTAEDDPFSWRERLPLARVGLCEVMVGCSVLALLAAAVWWVWWPLALAPLACVPLIVWFFRDPQRSPPDDANAVLAPADGRVVRIDRVEDDFVGPAWLIGVFLSVFDVHLNRAPLDALVVGQTYRPGKFLNALRARSAQENEWLELRLQAVQDPHCRLRVRQIAGALARRIVCWVAPGQTLHQGCRFGMIKIGSRTDLVVPRDVQLNVSVGNKVRAGQTILARFKTTHGNRPTFTKENGRQPGEVC